MLKAVRVSTPEHVEALRRLRNQTTSGFSSFNGQISEAEQVRWWEQMHDRIKAWLYWSDYEEAWVGFGLLRREDDGRWWNSIGVDPMFQGAGYGSYITSDLISRHDGPIYAAVRQDNLPAIYMHHTDDWVVIDGVDNRRLVYFRSRV